MRAFGAGARSSWGARPKAAARASRVRSVGLFVRASTACTAPWDTPAWAAGVDEGRVSRLAVRLEADRCEVREPNGALRVKDPSLLLDAWRAEYRFDRHTLIQGSVAARSGDALTRFVGDTLASAKVEHAATGAHRRSGGSTAHGRARGEPTGSAAEPRRGDACAPRSFGPLRTHRRFNPIRRTLGARSRVARLRRETPRGRARREPARRGRRAPFASLR